MLGNIPPILSTWSLGDASSSAAQGNAGAFLAVAHLLKQCDMKETKFAAKIKPTGYEAVDNMTSRGNLALSRKALACHPPAIGPEVA